MLYHTYIHTYRISIVGCSPIQFLFSLCSSFHKPFHLLHKAWPWKPRKRCQLNGLNLFQKALISIHVNVLKEALSILHDGPRSAARQTAPSAPQPPSTTVRAHIGLIYTCARGFRWVTGLGSLWSFGWKPRTFQARVPTARIITLEFPMNHSWRSVFKLIILIPRLTILC